MSASNTKRIAKNTLMLYFRQILIMLVSLYTVRVVLETLGAEDYGLYNVVAGIVTMFNFLSGGLATASQRYFSFELGRKDYEQLKKTFSVSFISYILITVIIVLLAESLGLWYVHTRLKINPERVFAARIIYQTSIVSLAFTVMTSPYMAAIIAHEDMSIYAYVSILEVSLKLLLVFLLPILGSDRLIVYGLLMMAVVIINTTVYRTICRKKYEETKAGWIWDKKLFREIMSFSGWNIFGASVKVFKNQGINILLNQFFNPVVVTARSIAFQVNSAVNSFAQNFSTAVRPQIIKEYASGHFEGMKKLVYQSSKGTFFLMYLFTLPLCLEMHFTLSIWLKTPPQFAVLFTQLTLIDILIESINYPLMTAAQATGKIRLYQGLVGGILLLNLPVSYLFLSLNFPAVAVFIIAICITLVAGITRLIILKILIQFSLLSFLTKVYIPLLASVILSMVLPVIVSIKLEESFLRFVLITLLSVLSIGIFGYFIGLSKDEKKAIQAVIKAKIKGYFHA